MVGIIHLAPLGTGSRAQATNVIEAKPKGQINVIVHPWGRVLVDGQQLGTTPMAQPLELEVGTHTIRIENDFFAPLEQTVEIRQDDDPDQLIVDLWEQSTPTE
jgi:hypothetical protein